MKRDTEIVAQSLFGLGKRSSVSFRRPHAIHPRTQAGIDELEEMGMIEKQPKGELPKGAVGYNATDKIGFPLHDFIKGSEEESFPILIQEGNKDGI